MKWDKRNYIKFLSLDITANMLRLVRIKKPYEVGARADEFIGLMQYAKLGDGIHKEKHGTMKFEVKDGYISKIYEE